MLSAELQLKKEAIDAAHRSHLYEFFSRVYSRVVSYEFLNRTRSSNLNIFLQESGSDAYIIGDSFDGSLIDDLAVEYFRLFYGPGKHISPYESIHYSNRKKNDDLLWDEPTSEIERLLSSIGRGPRYTGFPDHISVQLEFMQHLVDWEQKSWRTGDVIAALRHRQQQNDFIQNHLICWIPEFCNQVIRWADLPFYRKTARLTKAFIEFEMDHIEPNFQFLTSAEDKSGLYIQAE